MPEILRVYDLSGKFLREQERSEFYTEIRQEWEAKGTITRQVEVVRFLLMTTEGRIYVQMRSKTKSENPGLFDKTVGGHVKAGYSEKLAAFMECQEELAIPMAVLSKRESRIVISDNDMRVIGMMWKLGRVNGELSVRQAAGGAHIVQPLIVNYYLGYYDGSIRFKDGESSGVQTFSLKELDGLIAKAPDQFTDDLSKMVARYRRHLVPLVRHVQV